MTACYEHGNVLSGFIKGGRFVEQLWNHKVAKEYGQCCIQLRNIAVSSLHEMISNLRGCTRRMGGKRCLPVLRQAYSGYMPGGREKNPDWPPSGYGVLVEIRS